MDDIKLLGNRLKCERTHELAHYRNVDTRGDYESLCGPSAVPRVAGGVCAAMIRHSYLNFGPRVVVFR
jgi:hypothetical protein